MITATRSADVTNFFSCSCFMMSPSFLAFNILTIRPFGNIACGAEMILRRVLQAAACPKQLSA